MRKRKPIKRKKLPSRRRYTPQKRPQRPVRRTDSRRPMFKLRWLLLLIFIIPAILYIKELDEKVRTQFEGKTWELPAHVFAAPLELYPSMELTASMLHEELKRVDYTRSDRIKHEGDYFQRGNRFVIKTRAFTFWDGKQASRLIQLRLKNNTLHQMADIETKQSISIFRLQPRLIAKIYPAHNEDRILVSINKMPPLLIKALIAMEDKEFYNHNGLSFRGIARAMLTNLKHFAWREGGSTITQQVVKNIFLSSKRSLSRKIPEALMSILLELHYEKDRILEAYLNEVYQGQDGSHGIHGVGMGAWFYFNRSLDQLNLAELATLVSVIRGASMYNPRRHPTQALDRRNLILSKMYEQKLIDETMMLDAQLSPLGISKQKSATRYPYPHFIDLVREQLHRDYKEEDLYSEGLRIFTTLNPFIQKKAEQAMVNRIAKLERGNNKIPKNKLEGAFVVTDTNEGEVLALVGGRKPRYDGFNRALQTNRPIGSVVKPAIYLTALEQSTRYSLLSKLSDTTFEWEDKNTGEIWKPRNYSGREHGQVPLHKALASSYNLATVQLGFDLGLDKVRNTIERMGITRKFKVYPSMLLGGVSMTPFEVAQMYQTLASRGFNSPLRAIRAVMNYNGESLNRYAIQVEKRFSEASIFVLNHALQEVIRKGTGKNVAAELLPSDWALAGKTGTTNNYRDSWFAGFGNDILAVSWLGRDDNRSIHLSGGDGAMRVWADFMRKVKPESLPKQPPNGISLRWVNSSFGRDRMPFISGSSRYRFGDKTLALTTP